MFKITITEIKDVKTIKTPEWTTVEKRPYTPEELKNSGDSEYYKQQLKSVTGHTPEIEQTVQVEIEILKQVIDDLDLNNVIKAINKI